MTNADGVEIPTAAEAREIALRFINSHFNNPDRERPRISIPANRKRDDDLRLAAFIKWAGELEAVLRAAGEAEDGGDDDAFDAASDALWAKAREVASKPPREGVSEKTSPLKPPREGVSEKTSPLKDTVKDAKGHAAEVSDSEDEPSRGDEVRRGS